MRNVRKTDMASLMLLSFSEALQKSKTKRVREKSRSWKESYYERKSIWQAEQRSNLPSNPGGIGNSDNPRRVNAAGTGESQREGPAIDTRHASPVGGGI